MKGSWIIQKSKQLRLSLSGHVRSPKPDWPWLLPFIFTAQTLREDTFWSVYILHTIHVCVCVFADESLPKWKDEEASQSLVSPLLSYSVKCRTPDWEANKNRDGVDGWISLEHSLHHSRCHSLFNLQISFPYFPLSPPPFSCFSCVSVPLLHLHLHLHHSPSPLSLLWVLGGLWLGHCVPVNMDSQLYLWGCSL